MTTTNKPSAIDSMQDFKRRQRAVEITNDIRNHPAYPFDSDFPRAMITIIERGLKEWEALHDKP